MSLVSFVFLLLLKKMFLLQKRKRSVSQESSNKTVVSKSKRKELAEEVEKWMNLRVLPPNVMRTLVENMSVEEHATFRGVCKYAHDVSTLFT